MLAVSRSKWIFATFAILGAAILCLGCAIVGVFIARAHLIEANEWVRHTAEVALSIGSCRLQVREAQLDTQEQRPVAVANARADAKHIRILTADNAAQQLRVTSLVSLLQAFAGDREGADRIDLALREMEIVEGALMDVRMAALARARRSGWLIISVSSLLTVVLIAILLGMLYRNSRALTSAHLQLRQEGAMLESVVDSMVDGVIAVAPDRTFLHVNRAARRLLGSDFPETSFPKDWRASIECRYEDGTEMKPEDGALARAILGKSTDNLIYRTRQVGDATDPGIWIAATARPVCDADGSVIAAVVALRDISEQKRQQDQLHAMSMLDELTGLHNRRGFLMLAEQHARVAQRQGTSFGVVFVDLNGLKTVNDSFGHEMGDQMIRAAGDILRQTFRDSDILARLGGDEFVVLLANTDSTMQEAIAVRLEEGVTLRNAGLVPARQLSFSVGIAFFDPRQPLPLGELMIEADRLMYADKRQRRRLDA